MRTKPQWRYDVLPLVLMLASGVAAHPTFAYDDPDDHNKRISITLGQPSIWSLAQAHYLIGRLHEEADDLKTKTPTAEDLDPNAINMNRLEVLRTFFGLSAAYDQGVGIKNRTELERYRGEVERRDAARAQLDERRNRQLELARRISALKSELALVAPLVPIDETGEATKAGGGPNTPQQAVPPLVRKQQLEAQIAALEAEKAVVDTQVQALQTDASAAVTSPSLASASLPDVGAANGLDSGVADKAIEDFFDKKTDPKLAASNVLDNHLGFYYEILAKQLTLLRDEVGPNERLVFLELPTSIYSVPKRADDYVARVTWTVTEYKTDPELAGAPSRFLLRVEDVTEPWSFVSRLKVRDDPFLAYLYDKLPVETKGEMSKFDDTGPPTKTLLKMVVDEINVLMANERVFRDYVAKPSLPFPKEIVDLVKQRTFGEERIRINRLLLEHVFAGEIENATDLARVRRDTRNLLRAMRSSSKGNKFRRQVLVEEVKKLPLFVGKTFDQNAYPVLENQEKTELSETEAEKLLMSIGLSERIRNGSIFTPEVVTVAQSGPLTQEELERASPATPRYAAERRVRAVDLIPRQSALNINDVHAKTSRFNLAGILSMVTGFGLKIDYQRQKELYEQFINQEVFATAFGKGERQFGWTFGPKPGSRRIEPGLRTTYAVLVVPHDASVLYLRADAHYFHRTNRAVAPDGRSTGEPAQKDKEFAIVIPASNRDGFWIDDVSYASTQRGRRVSVVLEGRHFSQQMGVLVDGYPLTRMLSITDPTRSRRQAPSGNPVRATGPRGEIEFVGLNRLIFSFSMADEYEGTPTITLVSPGKVASINDLRLNVNGTKNTSLRIASKTDPMFRTKLRLDAILEFPPPPGVMLKTYLLIGEGFRHSPDVFVNGVQASSADVQSTRRCTIQIEPAVANDPVLTVGYSHLGKQGVEEEIKTFANPRFRSISSPVIQSYIPATPTHEAKLVVFFAVLGASMLDVQRAPGEPVIVKSVRRMAGGVQAEIDLGKGAGDPIFLSVLADGETYPAYVPLPRAPTITMVANANTGKPSGGIAGGDVVLVHGVNLQYVKAVRFGARPAELLEGPSDTVLRVVAPPGTAGTVQIVLETDVRYRGHLLTNLADLAPGGKAGYTYEAPPPKTGGS